MLYSISDELFSVWPFYPFHSVFRLISFSSLPGTAIPVTLVYIFDTVHMDVFVFYVQNNKKKFVKRLNELSRNCCY